MSAPEAKVVELGPHCDMTPEEALAVASRKRWQDVVVCGFDEDGDFVSLSSNMTREEALWMAEHLKLHAMGRLDT